MGEVVDKRGDREWVIEQLVGLGAVRSMAAQYADVYLEYQEASSNIKDHGVMVLHPRTSNPIENPYLTIRDRALRKLQGMRGVKCEPLW